MSEPYLGEINIFPYQFDPRGWTWCNGCAVPIAQNPALYSVIGTIYGGDGRQTFQLPNLTGRVPMGFGEGQGLSYRMIGDSVGSQSVTLTESQLPEHTHVAYASMEYSRTKLSNAPAANSYPAIMANNDSNIYAYKKIDNTLAPMADNTLSYAGESYGHENLQPFLAMNYFIAFEGLYPSRP